jgi:hypothetical protein
MSVLFVATAAPAAAAFTASVSDNTLTVGETITVTVDGSGGYGGADLLAVTSCSNANTAGQPLLVSGADACFGPESFVASAATCIFGGNFNCGIRVTAVSLFPEDIRQDVLIPINAVSPDYPTVVVSHTTVTEGDNGVTLATIDFTIDEPAPGAGITWVAEPLRAHLGVDFSCSSGGFFFTGTETTKQVGVSAYGVGFVAIIDDDDPPTVSLGVDQASERNSGTNTALVGARLSEDSGKTVSVDWTSAGLTATGLVDFIPGSDTLVFPPGSTYQPIPVEVVGDRDVETRELVLVATNDHVNATPGDNSGWGGLWIENDDNADYDVPFAPGVDLSGSDFSGQFIANSHLNGVDASWIGLHGTTIVNPSLENAIVETNTSRGTSFVGVSVTKPISATAIFPTPRSSSTTPKKRCSPTCIGRAMSYAPMPAWPASTAALATKHRSN